MLLFDGLHLRVNTRIIGTERARVSSIVGWDVGHQITRVVGDGYRHCGDEGHGRGTMQARVKHPIKVGVTIKAP